MSHNSSDTKAGTSAMEMDKKFDFGLEDSAIDRRLSLVTRYHAYFPFLSLWHSMVDELRILPETEDGTRILLGMGSMGWSGGQLNCSPFCLVKTSKPSIRV